MAPANRVSIAVARCIPAVLVLVVAYASYVVLGPLTVHYLLSPSPHSGRPRQLGAGIAVPTVYGVLLVPVVAAWLRLLVTVLTEPGYVPQGALPHHRHPTVTATQPGLQDFWTRRVFVCDPSGLPVWCHHCHNWKPDRAHHSRDVGRCTRKMDHFCPWVGGVVGERSLKFFLQFLFYSMIFTAYLTAVFGWYVAESKHHTHWYVVLALAAFFLLFTAGMLINSLNMVFQNTTTIEQVRGKMCMAVILPRALHLDPPAPPPPAMLAHASMDGGSRVDSDTPVTEESDHPAHHHYSQPQPRPTQPQPPPHSPPPSKLYNGPTITYPLQPPTHPPSIPAPEPRMFAVVELPRGLNPWNLGSVVLNFKAVFGNTFLDWTLPLKHSPCCDHSSHISEYPLGPEFELVLADAGLINPASRSPSKRERRPSTPTNHSARHRKRKRRLDTGWQNGERPDGWVSEKEARRIRNEWRTSTKQNNLFAVGKDQPSPVPDHPSMWHCRPRTDRKHARVNGHT